MNSCISGRYDAPMPSDADSKRPPGQPPKPMPEPIDDTPENTALAIVSTPPKRDDEWRYLQDDTGLTPT